MRSTLLRKRERMRLWVQGRGVEEKGRTREEGDVGTVVDRVWGITEELGERVGLGREKAGW